MTKSDDHVAQNIAAEFKKHKLLADATVDKLVPKIAAGSITWNEWKVLFEANRETKSEAAK